MKMHTASRVGVLGLSFLFTLIGCSGGGGGGAAPGLGIATQNFAAVKTLPANGSIEVSSISPIVVTFNKELLTPLPLSVSLNLSRLDPVGGGTPVLGTLSAQGVELTFLPLSSLEPNSAYSVSLGAGVKSVTGETLPQSLIWTFKTQDTVLPYILQTSPLAGAQDVNLTEDIQITFSEPIKASTANNNSVILFDSQNQAVPSTVFCFNELVVLHPLSGLLPLNNYTVYLTQDVQDLAGNGLGASYSWTFVSLDTSAPKVVSTIPENGAQDVEISGGVTSDPLNPYYPVEIRAEFSKKLKVNTVNTATFFLKDEFGGLVTGSVEYDPSGPNPQTAIFKTKFPQHVLALDTVYTVTLKSTITDLGGVPLGADYSWVFHTRSGWGHAQVLDSKPQELGSLVSCVPDALGKSFHLLWETGGPVNSDLSYNTVSLYPPDPSQVQLVEGGSFSSFSPRGLSAIPIASSTQNHFFWTEMNFSSSWDIWDLATSSGGPSQIYLNSLSSWILNPDLVPQIHADVKKDSGTVYAVWAQHDAMTNNYEIVVSEIVSAYGTFFPLTQIVFSSETPELFPQVAVAPDGAIFVAWQEGNGPASKIMVKKLSNWNDPSSWENEEIVSGGGAQQNLLPQIKIVPTWDGYEVFVCFYQVTPYDNNRIDVIMNRYRSQYAGWDWPIPLGQGLTANPLDVLPSPMLPPWTTPPTLPEMTLGPNNTLYVVMNMSFSGSAPYSVFVNRFVVGAAWESWYWEGPMEIDGSSVDVRDPHIAIDNNGRAMTIWKKKTPDGVYSVQACELLIDSEEGNLSWAEPQSIDDYPSPGNPQPDARDLSLTVDPLTGSFLAVYKKSINAVYNYQLLCTPFR